MVLRRIARPGVGIGQPAVAETAGRPVVLREVARERDAHTGLAQRLAELGDDLRRGVVEPIQDPQQARSDVLVVGASPRGRSVARQPEQVIALTMIEVQSLCDGGDHLFGRLRTSCAFESCVVVSRHVAQCRDFLTSQPVGAATLAAGESDILRLQGLASVTQELSQPRAIDLRARPPLRLRPFYPGQRIRARTRRSASARAASRG